MYKALKDAKKLIAYEQELLRQCKTRHKPTGRWRRQIANPRELEADLLLKAASQLQAVHDAWDRKRPELDAALLYNRKLWSIFLTSVTSPEHAVAGRHPPERRQSRPVRDEPDRGDDEQSASASSSAR